MLGAIGIPGLILILIVALLLFGPNKLPELGRAFGKTLSEFKKGTRDMLSDEDATVKSESNVKQIESSNNESRQKQLPD